MVTGRTYLDVVNDNLCDDCVAACCRMLLIAHPAPQTFDDVDYLVFALGFRNLELVVRENGDWALAVMERCRHLDDETSRCTVYRTEQQPRLCINFPPDNCWYRRSFLGPETDDVVRLDLDRFRAVLADVHFDDAGRIVEAPSFAAIRDAARAAGPVSPVGRPPSSSPAAATPPVAGPPPGRSRVQPRKG